MEALKFIALLMVTMVCVTLGMKLAVEKAGVCKPKPVKTCIEAQLKSNKTDTMIVCGVVVNNPNPI